MSRRSFKLLFGGLVSIFFVLSGLAPTFGQTVESVLRSVQQRKLMLAYREKLMALPSGSTDDVSVGASDLIPWGGTVLPFPEDGDIKDFQSVIRALNRARDEMELMQGWFVALSDGASIIPIAGSSRGLPMLKLPYTDRVSDANWRSKVVELGSRIRQFQVLMWPYMVNSGEANSGLPSEEGDFDFTSGINSSGQLEGNASNIPFAITGRGLGSQVFRWNFNSGAFKATNGVDDNGDLLVSMSAIRGLRVDRSRPVADAGVGTVPSLSCEVSVWKCGGESNWIGTHPHLMHDLLSKEHPEKYHWNHYTRLRHVENATNALVFGSMVPGEVDGGAAYEASKALLDLPDIGFSGTWEPTGVVVVDTNSDEGATPHTRTYYRYHSEIYGTNPHRGSAGFGVYLVALCKPAFVDTLPEIYRKAPATTLPPGTVITKGTVESVEIHLGRGKTDNAQSAWLTIRNDGFGAPNLRGPAAEFEGLWETDVTKFDDDPVEVGGKSDGSLDIPDDASLGAAGQDAGWWEAKSYLVNYGLPRLKQVMGGDVLVDISYPTTYKKLLKFYWKAGIGAKVNGYYPVSGTPFKTIELKNPTAPETQAGFPTTKNKLLIVEDGQVYNEVLYSPEVIIVNDGGDEVSYDRRKWTLRTGASATNFAISRTIDTSEYSVDGLEPWKLTTSEGGTTSVVELKCESLYTPSDVDRPVWKEGEFGPESPTAESPRRKVTNEWQCDEETRYNWILKKTTFSGDPNWELNGAIAQYDVDELPLMEQSMILEKTHVVNYGWVGEVSSKRTMTSKLGEATYSSSTTEYKKPANDAQFLIMENSFGEGEESGPVTTWTFASPTDVVPWETSLIVHPGGYRESTVSNLVEGQWVTLEKEGWGEEFKSGTQTVTTLNRFGGLVSKVVGTSAGTPLQSALGSDFTPWGAPRQLTPLRGPARAITYVETAGPAFGSVAGSTDPYALAASVTARDWLGRPTNLNTGFTSIVPDYSNPLKSKVTTSDGVIETEFNIFGDAVAHKDSRGSGVEADLVPGTAKLKVDGRQVTLDIEKLGEVAGVNSGLGQRGSKVSIDVESEMFCVTNTSLKQDNSVDYSVKTYFDQEGRVKKVDHHPSGQDKFVEEWTYDDANRTTTYQPSGAPSLKGTTETLSADGSTLTCTVEGGAPRRYIKSEQGSVLVLVTEVKDDSDEDANQDTWNQLSRKEVNPSTGEIASTAWDLTSSRQLVTDPLPAASVTVAPSKEGNPDDPKVEFENGRPKRMYGKKGGVQFDLNQWVYEGDRLEKVAGTVGGKSTGVEFDSSGRLKRAWGPGHDKRFVPSGTSGQTITVTDVVQNTTQTINISQVGDFAGLSGDGVFPLTANTSDQGGGVTSTSVNGSVTVNEDRNRLVTKRQYSGFAENVERNPDGSVKKYGVGPEAVDVSYENGTITSDYVSDGMIEEKRYKVGLRSEISGPHGDKRQTKWKRGRLASETHVGGTWDGASVGRQQNGAGEMNAVNVNVPSGSFSQSLIKDGHGRPWTVSGQGGFTGTYYYDPVTGQLDTFTRGPLTTKWTRDELGRIDHVTTKIDATPVFSYDHDYNSKNLRTKRAANGAGTSWTGLSYDSQHRLTDATVGSAKHYDYDARGNRLTGGSVAETWTINGLDQVTGRTLGQRGYGVAGTVAPGAKVRVYHPLAPLGEELTVDPQTGYYAASWGVEGTFGAGGVSRVEILVRGTLEGAGTGGTDAVADKQLWVTVQAAVESFEYDGAGRLVGDSNWDYEWDGQGNLIGLERKAAAITDPTISSEVLSFRYDADGRRVRKLRTVNYVAGGTRLEETKMLWDGWLPVYDERSLNGTVVSRRKFLWGRDISGGWDSAGGIGGLVAIQEVDGRTLIPVDDGLGNIMALVDGATQATVATYDHGPFGELIGKTGEPDACPFLYQSKLFDSETGLYYFGYRYYSPKLGRWLSRDPLAEKGGVNLYAYCVNDPVNKHDFLGRKPELYWTDSLSDSAFIDACGQPKVNYWDWAGSNWLSKGWNAVAGGSATIEARTPTQDELARFFRRDSNGTWRVATVNEYKDASWAQFGESLPGEMQDAMGAIKIVMNFHYGAMALASGGIILVEGGITVGTLVAAGHEGYAGVSMLVSVVTGDDYARSPAGAVAGLCGASEGIVGAIDLVTGFGSQFGVGRGRNIGRSSSGRGSSYATGGQAPSSGYSHSKEAIVKALEVAKQTKTSQAVLNGIQSGKIDMQLTSSGGAGRAMGGKIYVNHTMSMPDVLSTIVHEGRHHLDIVAGIIPKRNPGGAMSVFAEMRAWSSSANFAVRNGFTNRHSIFFDGWKNPVHLAIEIADSPAYQAQHGLPISDATLLEAVQKFINHGK